MFKRIKSEENISSDNRVRVAFLAAQGSQSLKNNDYCLAFSYFSEACQLNNYLSCTAVAIIKSDPKSTIGINITEAIQYAKKGCDGREKGACTYLATMYVQEKNIQEASKAYKLACEYGDEFSCEEAKRLSKK